MAKLNLNLLLSNVAVNAVAVAKRMGRGSKLAERATATTSQGWPVPTGPEPIPSTRLELRLDLIERDATRVRAGRSAVSPNAGGFVRCRAWHARPAVAFQAKRQLAYQPDVMSGSCASAMWTIGAR